MGLIGYVHQSHFSITNCSRDILWRSNIYDVTEDILTSIQQFVFQQWGMLSNEHSGVTILVPSHIVKCLQLLWRLLFF